MMPNSNEPRPTIDSSAPTGSSRGAVGSFDSGTKKWPATSAIAPIGRFTQNTELHEKWRSSTPPITGPSATPRPEKPGPDGDRPTAFLRVAEHVGQDRQRRRHDQRAADAHQRPGGDQLRRRTGQRDSTEPIAKITMPTRSARLRPNWSPRLPVVSSRPANTSV